MLPESKTNIKKQDSLFGKKENNTELNPMKTMAVNAGNFLHRLRSFQAIEMPL